MTNPPSLTTLHLMTQSGQPYGSERRCCEVCGAMLVSRPESFWKNNTWTDKANDYKHWPAGSAVVPDELIPCRKSNTQEKAHDTKEQHGADAQGLAKDGRADAGGSGGGDRLGAYLGDEHRGQAAGGHGRARDGLGEGMRVSDRIEVHAASDGPGVVLLTRDLPDPLPLPKLGAGPVLWQCRKGTQAWGPGTTTSIARRLNAEGYDIRALAVIETIEGVRHG